MNIQNIGLIMITIIKKKEKILKPKKKLIKQKIIFLNNLYKKKYESKHRNDSQINKFQKSKCKKFKMK